MPGPVQDGTVFRETQIGNLTCTCIRLESALYS